jgi:hypothetical protein
MRLLIKTEQDHARPTESVQEKMRKAWGWVSAGGKGEAVISYPGWRGNIASTHIMSKGGDHEMSL